MMCHDGQATIELLIKKKLKAKSYVNSGHIIHRPEQI